MKEKNLKCENQEFGSTYYQQDFPLTVRQETIQSSTTYRHLHTDFWDLGIVLKGTATLNVEEQQYKLIPGDIFVIGEKQLHHYSEIRNFTYCNVLMNLQKLKIPMQYLSTRPGYQLLFVIDRQNKTNSRFKNRFRLSPEQLEETSNRLLKLKNLIPARKFEATAHLMLLLDYLCNCAELSIKNAIDIPLKLSLVAAEMEKNSEKKFTIDSLCRKAGMSRASFFRYFNLYYGVSPLEYLLKLRIRRSMQLLKETKLSCGEVGLSCGFVDSSYFTLHFHKITGMTPHEYRTATNIEPPPGFPEGEFYI